MKKIFSLILLGLLAVQLNAGLTKEVKELLSQAKKEVSATTVDELNKLMQKDEVVLLDIRSVNEWKKGVIESPRLIRIQRGLLEFRYETKILDEYTKDQKIVVYCKSDPRSIFAVYRLKQLGFTNVTYLKGGIKEWNKNK